MVNSGHITTNEISLKLSGEQMGTLVSAMLYKFLTTGHHILNQYNDESWMLKDNGKVGLKL